MSSVRNQIAEEVAERTSDSGNREEYRCKFDWEISDERLFERFIEKLVARELTVRQVRWYVKRLNFRNVFIPDTAIALLRRTVPADE